MVVNRNAAARSSEIVFAITLVFIAVVFSACTPPGPGKDVVSLEGGLKRGDTNVLKHYLGNAKVANTVLHRRRKGYFTTPLIVAAEVGDTNAINLLLWAGADVNGTNSRGGTALLQLMAFSFGSNRYSAAQYLLQEGASVGKGDRYGNTPLSYAARFREPGFVKLLLAHGADITSRNVNGYSVLHQVQTITNAAILLEPGADILSTNIAGQTPAETALEWNKTNLYRWLKDREKEKAVAP